MMYFICLHTNSIIVMIANCCYCCYCTVLSVVWDRLRIVDDGIDFATFKTLDSNCIEQRLYSRILKADAVREPPPNRHTIVCNAIDDNYFSRAQYLPKAGQSSEKVFAKLCFYFIYWILKLTKCEKVDKSKTSERVTWKIKSI